MTEQGDLFCPIAPIPASNYLKATLDETVTLAIAITNALVAVVVEAKNENIKGRLCQCMQHHCSISANHCRIVLIYGVVTTGKIWKFLKLMDQTVVIDLSDYYVLRDLDQILEILLECRQVPVGSF